MPIFKKKLKDTKVGKFLKDKAPDILDGISDILPDKGLLGIAGNIIDRINKSDKLTPEDKEMALKLLEMDKVEMENVTERWKADMSSDSWLSKNSRPIVLLYFCFLITLLLVFAACKITMPEEYVYMIKEISMIVIISYYGSRGIEKYNEIKIKRGK